MKTEIGIFDSGVGGLSVLKALLNTSISEFVYVADTAYLPYGEQSQKTLLERGRVITDYFLSRGIHKIIVACHTSSATTLKALAREYPEVTFVDMLEPTIKAAAKTTKTNKIGVFATKATIKSHAHKKLFETINPDIRVIEQACPQLVPLIESNTTGLELRTALVEYLVPMQQEEIDTLILGCTHYAFLENEIKQLAPDLKLISANQEAAKLYPAADNSNPEVSFVTSGNPEAFKKKVKLLLNLELPVQRLTS